MQLFQRVAQIGVLAAVLGVDTAVDHRAHLAIARQRLGSRVFRAGDGVADLRFVHVLDARREIADLTGLEVVGLLQAERTHDAAFEYLVGRARRHHLDLHTRLERTLHQSHIDDDAAVSVVIAVKN